MNDFISNNWVHDFNEKSADVMSTELSSSVSRFEAVSDAANDGDFQLQRPEPSDASGNSGWSVVTPIYVGHPGLSDGDELNEGFLANPGIGVNYHVTDDFALTGVYVAQDSFKEENGYIYASYTPLDVHIAGMDIEAGVFIGGANYGDNLNTSDLGGDWRLIGGAELTAHINDDVAVTVNVTPRNEEDVQVATASLEYKL